MRLAFVPFLLATVLADCTYSTRPGDFEITIVKPSNAKRDLSTCGQTGILTISLNHSVLTDTSGRVGFISSGHQFQFAYPTDIQGALETSGFSLCNNGSLALLGTAEWYQCETTSGFYNIYTEPTTTACTLVNIDIVPCDGQSPVETTTSTTSSTTTSSSTSTSITASTTTTTSTTSSTATTSSSISVVASTTNSTLSYTHTSMPMSSYPTFISTGVVSYPTINSTYHLPSTASQTGSATGTPVTTAVHTGAASPKHFQVGLTGIVALLYICWV